MSPHDVGLEEEQFKTAAAAPHLPLEKHAKTRGKELLLGLSEAQLSRRKGEIGSETGHFEAKMRMTFGSRVLGSRSDKICLRNRDSRGSKLRELHAQHYNHVPNSLSKTSDMKL